MFTNEDILRVALEQSAIDSNCNWEDFLKKDNVIVTSVANPSARRYLKLPHVSLSQGYFWDSLSDCLR